jgi:hypothetical protein
LHDNIHQYSCVKQFFRTKMVKLKILTLVYRVPLVDEIAVKACKINLERTYKSINIVSTK